MPETLGREPQFEPDLDSEKFDKSESDEGKHVQEKIEYFNQIQKRAGGLLNGITSFFQKLLKKEEVITPITPREKLYTNLVTRKIILDGEQTDASEEELGEILDKFYKAKEDIYAIKQSEKNDFQLPMGYSNSEEQEKLDKEISDSETKKYIIQKEQRLEKKRQEKLRIEREQEQKRITKDILNLSISVKKHLPIYQRRKKEREEAFFYTEVKKQTEKELNNVNEILEKRELDENDIIILNNWIEKNKEFGLEEMSDEKYDSFFQNGKFYLHSTNFFTLRHENKIRPRFIEALKDGYLISKVIGLQRGEVMSGTAYEERTVSFDSEECLYRQWRNGREIPGRGNISSEFHFVYGVEQAAVGDLPPVVLICPARLLENHSTEEPRYKNGRRVGVAEGWQFGSADSDIWSKKHEIDLNIFTMLLPDTKIRIEFIERFFDNILTDKRFNLDEDKKAQYMAIKNKFLKQAKIIFEKEYLNQPLTQEEIDLQENKDPKQILYYHSLKLKEFMKSIVCEFKKAKIAIPRVYFYKIDQLPFERLGAKCEKVLDKGLKDFLKDKNILKPTHKRQIDKIGRSNLPEKYRVETSKLEKTANKVRLILKNNKKKD